MSIQQALISSSSDSMIVASSANVSLIETSGGGSTTVAIGYSPAGFYYTQRAGSVISQGSWVDVPSKAPDWEIRATLDSGDTPDTGTLSSWLPLTSLRTWTLSVSLPEFKSCTLTFEFRRAGTTSVVKTIPLNSMYVEKLDIFS